MQSVDYYAVLGVLPDAEHIVITAAYRALAQRYHPDRWSGAPEEAHGRMSSINAAYAVVGDPTNRKKYDESRARTGESDFAREQDGSREDEFSSALSDLEGRWDVATSVYPDLTRLRANLSKISKSLAFSFVVTMLELKAFEERFSVAKSMERSFLERYFGSNERVLVFALALVREGRRDAAMALNRLVDVLGPNSRPEVVLGKIIRDFALGAEYEARARVGDLNRKELDRYRDLVMQDSNLFSARALVKGLGYRLTERLRLFGGAIFHVTTPTNENLLFTSDNDFVEWVKGNLC